MLDVWPLGLLSLEGLRAPTSAPLEPVRAMARPRRISRGIEASEGGQDSGLKLAQGLGLKAMIGEKVPLFVLAVGASVLAYLAQGTAVVKSMPLAERVANALVAYVAYVGKMFWRAGLSVSYRHAATLPMWRAVASLAVAGRCFSAGRAAAGAAAVSRRRLVLVSRKLSRTCAKRPDALRQGKDL